jgi:hypothetical protein
MKTQGVHSKGGNRLSRGAKVHLKWVAEAEKEQMKKEEEEVNNMQRMDGENNTVVDHDLTSIIGPDFLYKEDEEIEEEEDEVEDEGIADRVVRQQEHRH